MIAFASFDAPLAEIAAISAAHAEAPHARRAAHPAEDVTRFVHGADALAER
jgi:hypothetical protein